MKRSLRRCFPLLLCLFASGYVFAEDANRRLDLAKWKSRSGDHKAAIVLLEASLADPQVQSDDYLAGVCGGLLGEERRILGDPLRAIEDQTKALARFERANDKGRQRACHLEIARAREQLKQVQEAIISYRNAVLMDKAGELDDELANDLRSLAQMQERSGDLSGALKTLQELLRFHEKNADIGAQGGCRIEMAGIYKKLGDNVAASAFQKEGVRQQEEAVRMYDAARGDEVFAVFNKFSRLAPKGDIAYKYAAYEAMLASSGKRDSKEGTGSASQKPGVMGANPDWHSVVREKLEEAVRLSREAKNRKEEVVALILLGAVLNNNRNLNTGLGRLEQAIRLARETGYAEGEVEALTVMQAAYSDIGDFPKSLEMSRRMMEVARHSKRKRLMIGAENGICGFYKNLGDSHTAVEHCRRALELAEELGDRELIGNMLNSYGIALINKGDYDLAITTLRKSLEIGEWGGGHVNIAEALLHKGEYEAAALELRPMGAHHIDMGYYYLARKYYEHARDIYKRALSGEMKDNKAVVYRSAAHTGLALAYEGLRDFVRAAYHFKAAEKLLERQRDSLSLEQRLFFLGAGDWMFSHIEPYEGMVRVSEFRGGSRDSLYHAEFTRGRLFAESAARNYNTPDARLPAALADRERRLTVGISSVAAQTETASRSPDQEKFHRLDMELAELKKQRGELVKEIRRGYPEYAALRYPEPIYVEEFALQPGEVLLEFEVTRPYTRVFVVKDGSVALSYNVNLSRNDLSGLVRKYRSFFEGVYGTEQLAAFDPKLGNRLYELLLKPAMDAVENGHPLIPDEARLILVPDEILSILPFESLVTSLPARLQFPSGRFGPAPVGISYVADKYDIAYAHSGTALTVQRRLKRKISPSREILVLADPIFSAADSRLRRGNRAVSPSPGQEVTHAIITIMGVGGKRAGDSGERTVGRDNSVFPRLDKTGLLAHSLTNKIFSGQPSEVLVGSSAAKSEFLDMDLSKYRYIVMATHGILDNMVPGLREPALVLNQVGNAEGDNGLLTMSEVMRLRLNADVVALTACQTGMGTHLTGEGVMGLGRAFQYAGARNVLVSLWNVSEGSTTMLAERFFSHLKQGKTMRQALRLAREDVRRAGYEHPFYWAPFILIGE